MRTGMPMLVLCVILFSGVTFYQHDKLTVLLQQVFTLRLMLRPQRELIMNPEGSWFRVQGSGFRILG